MSDDQQTEPDVPGVGVLGTVVRFVIAVIVTAIVVSFMGRMFSDFDEPPENDPHGLLRGIGVWLVAVLVAIANELRVRLRQH